MTACVIGGVTGSPVCADRSGDSTSSRQTQLAGAERRHGRFVLPHVVRTIRPVSRRLQRPRAWSTTSRRRTGRRRRPRITRSFRTARASSTSCRGRSQACPGGLSNFASLTAENQLPWRTPTTTHGFNVPITGNVLTNDTDVDSAAESLRVVLGDSPSHGSVVLNQTDPSPTHRPPASAEPIRSPTPQTTEPGANTGVAMSANSAPATVTIVVQETGPPLVTLTIPPPTGTKGWFKTKPVLVTVSASDSSNVASFTCTANGAADRGRFVDRDRNAGGQRDHHAAQRRCLCARMRRD